MPALFHLNLPYHQDNSALFLRLRHLPGYFLLRSCPATASARFDVFSALPPSSVRLPWQAGSDPAGLPSLTRQMIQRLHDFPQTTAGDSPLPGWYGLASYDLYGATLGMPLNPAHLVTDRLVAGFYPSVVVVDHQRHQCQLIGLPGQEAHAQTLMDALESESPTTPGFRLHQPFRSNMSLQDYGRRFAAVQNYLHAGDCYQVNLAQRFSAPHAGDPWHAFERLCARLAAPMASYFAGTDFQCLSLSPERFLQVRDRQIRAHPIKGTRPRHADPAQDQAIIQALRNSDKDRAENLMIVDLMRNDLGRCCEPGTIQVPELFAVESFTNVHHLVSTIQGKLRPDIHPLDAFFSAFPGGSITGAPKRRAVEIIAEQEPDNRSFYCGCAFYCDVGGKLDSSILIRSLVAQGNEIHCWGGGGIVADSCGEQEYQETLDKVGVILAILNETIG